MQTVSILVDDFCKFKGNKLAFSLFFCLSLRHGFSLNSFAPHCIRPNDDLLLVTLVISYLRKIYCSCSTAVVQVVQVVSTEINCNIHNIFSKNFSSLLCLKMPKLISKGAWSIYSISRFKFK